MIENSEIMTIPPVDYVLQACEPDWQFIVGVYHTLDLAKAGMAEVCSKPFPIFDCCFDYFRIQPFVVNRTRKDTEEDNEKGLVFDFKRVWEKGAVTKLVITDLL